VRMVASTQRAATLGAYDYAPGTILDWSQRSGGVVFNDTRVELLLDFMYGAASHSALPSDVQSWVTQGGIPDGCEGPNDESSATRASIAVVCVMFSLLVCA